ncbi:hypothetical protein V8D89_008848 [Ganoderma adspersum]
MTTQASPREHWEPIDIQGLQEFRDMYWGARGRAALKNVLARPPLERFLHLRQTAIQNLFNLSLQDGLFFVREEYRLLADRLHRAREEKSASEMQGCLLLGQQGVGKTYFLLFLLMQCLSREETVLFTSSLGDTYLFDEDGIVTTRTAQFRSFAHVPDDVPDPSERLWSLVDCSQAKEPIHSSVTYAARQLFFVAAARPDLSHCGDLKGRFNVREWWMSHWTENELRALLASLPPSQFPLAQPGRYPLSSPDTARSLIRDVGSCLQDILLYLTAPSRYEDFVNATISQYTSVEVIYHLLSGRDLSTNTDAQTLILISRAGPITPDTLDPNTDDRPIARFKTRSIHARVLANVTALSTQDTQRLYATFRAAGGPNQGGGEGGGAFAAASSALLFENMAVRYARTGDDREFFEPRFPPFRHPFAIMDRQTPPPLRPGMAGTARTTRAQAAAPVRFLYRSDGRAGRRTTVAISESGEVAWRPSRGVELVQREFSCLISDSDEPWANFPHGTHTWPSVAALCGAVSFLGSDDDDDDHDDEDEDDVPWTTAVSRADLDGAFFCPLTMLQSDSDSDSDGDRDSAPLPAAVFDAYALRVRNCGPREPDEIWAIRVATPRRSQGVKRGTRPSASTTTSTTTSTRDEGEGEGGFAAIARLKAMLRAGPGGERPMYVSYALIVPYDGAPEFGVEWSLPAAGFEEHPGGVYVQFLDVSAFGGDVAQVLGVPRPDKDVDGAPAAGPSVAAAKRGSKRRREGVE